jgi:hypothetical protein
VLGRLGHSELAIDMEGHDVFGSSGSNLRKDNGQTQISAPHSSPHKSEFEYDDEEQKLIEQRLADLGYLE